jgi:hypothetical protein
MSPALKLKYVPEQGGLSLIVQRFVCVLEQRSDYLIRTSRIGRKLPAFTYALAVFGQNNSAFLSFFTDN